LMQDYIFKNNSTLKNLFFIPTDSKDELAKLPPRTTFQQTISKDNLANHLACPIHPLTTTQRAVNLYTISPFPIG